MYSTDSYRGNPLGPQSAAFGPQQHGVLAWNPETLKWEVTEPQDEGYGTKLAALSARAQAHPSGGFRTLGAAESTGPDTSTEAERRVVSPLGQPEFYGGSGGGMGGAQMGGSLEGLRAYIAEQQKKQRGY